MNKNSNSDAEIFVLNDQYALLGDFLELPAHQITELDLGCGKGELAVAVAKRFPERRVLAADIMIGRLRKVLKKARRDGIDNLFFLRVEARHLVSMMLPDHSISRLHILCPDPWPKHRHKGNRLLSSDFMMQIHRVLRKDGIFHFATDDAPYLESTRKNVAESGLFQEVSLDCIADIADIKTGFELQWLAQGKTVPHVLWRPL